MLMQKSLAHRFARRTGIWLIALPLAGGNCPSLHAEPGNALACNLKDYSPQCRKLMMMRLGNTWGERFGVMEGTSLYSCNLIQTSEQCREYRMLTEEAAVKTVPLRDGCESMGGTFAMTACPEAGRLARCTNNVYNAHDPQSVYYSNHYYLGPVQQWTSENIERVCANLGGILIKAAPSP